MPPSDASPDAVRTAARLALAGAVLAGLCVAAGAFGAHALRDAVTPARLATFETGVRYGLVHGVALLALAALAAALPHLASAAARVGTLWALGALVFTGSLALLVLLDVPLLGAVTPIGGAAMIGGWAWLAAAAWRVARG